MRPRAPRGPESRVHRAQRSGRRPSRGLPGLGAGLELAAEGVNALSEAADPAITAALEGLTAVEEIIPHVVPPAAIAGSVQVSLKYNPLVKEAAAGNPVTTFQGLPVEAGDPSVLVFSGWQGVVDIIFGVIPGTGQFRDLAGGAFGDLGRRGWGLLL